MKKKIEFTIWCCKQRWKKKRRKIHTRRYL